MKKLIIIKLLIMTNFVSAQIFGIAGTNTAQTLTPEVRSVMTDLTVDTLGFCFRDDKYSTHAPQADLDNLVAWANEMRTAGKVLKTIYTVQCSGKSISDNTSDYLTLINSGIEINIIKLGNENYFKDAGNNSDFNNYIAYAQPLIDWFNSHGFTGTYLIPVSGENVTWDNAVSSYISAKPNFHLDVHVYWGRNDLKCFLGLTGTKKDQLPTSTVGTTYQITPDTFYQSMVNEITTSTLIQDEIDYYLLKFPGKKLYITEFGPAGNVGNLQNTIGFNSCEDWFYNQIKNYPQVKYVLKFNGPSPTGTGMISPKGSKDDPAMTGTYLKRLSYFTLYNFLRNKEAVHPMQITQPGSYTFTFQNMTRTDQSLPIEIAPGLQVVSKDYIAIHGSNYYSSSGACAWWSNTSTKSYEVAGINSFNDGISLSYGYIHVTVEAIPVPGCTDPLAINFNPAANQNDGSCYYFSDCGCKDRGATNYNPDAPCENNLLCTYPPPPICYEERKIFKWLGCKRDRDCSTNNCNSQ